MVRVLSRVIRTHSIIINLTMSEIKLKTIKAVPLNAEDYKPFGNVLEAKPKSESANQGTALRSDWLGNFFCVNKLIDRFIFY